MLEDGWVKARGFKLITSHIDLKCKCTSTMYMVSNVCTFCILRHCLKKFIRIAQTVLVYDLLVGVEM